MRRSRKVLVLWILCSYSDKDYTKILQFIDIYLLRLMLLFILLIQIAKNSIKRRFVFKTKTKFVLIQI